MKKLLSFLCVLTIGITLTACGSQSETQNVSEPEPNGSQTAGPQEPISISQPSEEEISRETENTIQMKEGSNILVAYFSATGTTKALAEYAADVMGADLYEIVPEEPYTDEDLDYGNSSSRSSMEQNDANARPVISGSVENMEQYDTIFLGYPIWWGEAPRIVYTFMESYDYSGKTIVPFCTSGSSGIGTSAKNLHGLAASDASWLDGERLSSGSSRNDIVSWINNLRIDVKAE